MLFNRRTEIYFADPNGNRTNLDGPLFFDPNGIYIDANGHIRADVPCFPDPNITQLVLGRGNKEAPADIGQFFNMLTDRVGGAAPAPDNASATVRRALMRAWSLQLASRIVQGA